MLTGPITSQPPSSLKSVENEAVHDGGGVNVVVRAPKDIFVAEGPPRGRSRGTRGCEVSVSRLGYGAEKGEIW